MPSLSKAVLRAKNQLACHITHVARPRKKIDLDRLRNLALIGCSHQVIATELGISHDTLTRHYHDEIEKGRGEAQTRILAKTFQSALNGNMRALELCLINRCGWASKPEMVINVNQNTIGLSAEEIPAEVLTRHRALMLELAREDEQRARLTQGDSAA